MEQPADDRRTGSSGGTAREAQSRNRYAGLLSRFIPRHLDYLAVKI